MPENKDDIDLEDWDLLLAAKETRPDIARALIARGDDVGAIDKEACPLNLAPTSSTTAMLVLGDIIAITLLQAKKFTKNDFAFSHPCGSLGRKLLLTIEHIMHSHKSMPIVSHNASLKEALMEMTSKRLGITTVIDANHKLIGVFTDGDLRRTLEHDSNFHCLSIQDVMTTKFKTANKSQMETEALLLMEQNQISVLPVVNESLALEGIIHLHDIIKAGIV